MSTNERIRGRTLQRIRQSHLYAHPLCERCLARGQVTPAEEVDHIIAIDNGGTDTPDNRQSLCKPCHKDKTNEDFGRQVKGCDADGWPRASAHHWRRPEGGGEVLPQNLPVNRSPLREFCADHQPRET